MCKFILYEYQESKMKTWRLALASVALFVSTSGFSKAPANDWRQQLFERLAMHPDFTTTLYSKQALIMERAGTFYAAIAVVQSEVSPLVCAYAAPFPVNIGERLGSYVLKPRYLCDTDTKLKPYIGYFEVKYPGCGGEVCANPAIGVGNLDILPDFSGNNDLPWNTDLPFTKLPKLLPVKVTGRFDLQYDASLPVAGRLPEFNP
jgi:hypothetical protein